MYKDAIGLSCELAEIMKEYDDPRIEAILTEAIEKLEDYHQEQIIEGELNENHNIR